MAHLPWHTYHGTPTRSSLLGKGLISSAQKYRAEMVQTIGDPGTPAIDTPASALKNSIVKALVPYVAKARRQQALFPIVEETGEVEVSSELSGIQRMSSTESESTEQQEGVQGASGGGTAAAGRGHVYQRHIQNISSKLQNFSFN